MEIWDALFSNAKWFGKFYDEFIEMNSSQKKAIQNALKYHLSLVIGPPGTGKTLLLVNLVFNLLSIKGSTDKILITAPTNKAIDNIIIILKKYGFEKFVRVLSPSKELSEDLDTTRPVHKLALEKIYKEPKKYGELIKLYEKVAELNGIRLELYYINQNLWDMNFYSKVNSAIDTFVKEYLYVKIRRLKK